MPTLWDRKIWTLGLAYATAGLLALAICMVLGLDNPYWAGVAVWVTATQPSRGLLVHRVLFRFLGTAAGSFVGYLIVISESSPLGVVVALAVWLTCCAAVGNLFRQFRAYAVFLAGYTAAIVVLPSYFDSAHAHHFAEARIACNFIGLFSVTAVMLAFKSAALHETAIQRATKLANDVLGWTAKVLQGGEADAAALRRFTVELASLEEAADTAARPTLDGFRSVRGIRHAAMSLLMLVSAVSAHARKRDGAAENDVLILAGRILERIAAAAGEERAAADDRLLALPVTPHLSGVLPAVQAAVTDLRGLEGADDTATDSGNSTVFFYDMHAVRLSALRTFVAVMATGLFWVFTGWKDGAAAMVGTSIFITVLSNLETARQLLETIMKGAATGVAVGLIALVTVLPLAHGPVSLLLVVAPFIFIGSLAMAYPPTARPAIDGNAFFLMTLQLSWPIAVTSVWSAANNAVAVLIGMMIPWLAYYLTPLKSSERVEALTAHIVNELGLLDTREDDRALKRRRLRLYNSVMRLALRLSTRPNNDLLDSALAALGVADAALSDRDGTGAWRGPLKEAVARLSPRAGK